MALGPRAQEPPPCPCRYDGLHLCEVDPHLEELLGLVVWLTTCGRAELKVFDSVTYPQLEGFKFHQEASGGSCVSGARSGHCALTGLPRLLPGLCKEANTWGPVLSSTWGDGLWI